MAVSVQRFSSNTLGRDFVLGDLHGCYALFEQLLEAVHFDRDVDRIFCVGDLIDRGLDSTRCAHLLSEPWFYSVRGNHEEMLLEAVRNKNETAREHWIINGGMWHLAIASLELAEIAGMMAELPFVIIVGEGADEFRVLHAEWCANDEYLAAGRFTMFDEATLTWGREVIRHNVKPQVTIPTYVGHSIVHQPMQIGALHFIDTGGFQVAKGNSHAALTLVEPKTNTYWRATNGSCASQVH